MSQPLKKRVRKIRKTSETKSLEEESSISLLKVTENVKNDDIDGKNIQNEAKISVSQLYMQIIDTKDELLNAKDTIIKELNEKVMLLKEKIEFLTKNQNLNDKNCLLYSEVTKNISKPKVPIINIVKENEKASSTYKNTIIIKPTNIQENKKTRKDIGKYINPTKLNVEITKIEDIKDGGIKIICNSKEEIQTIQKEAQNNLGNNYSLVVSEKRNPRIKIVGIEDEMSEEELVKSILEKNSFIKNSKVKLITMKKMKKKYLAILEIDCISFKNIMEKGFLFIDFSICSVYEHVDITRCFNCAGYYHSAKTCTKEKVCMKCGNTGHTANECTSSQENFKCPNCSEINQKFNQDYFINHSPFDFKCETFIQNIEKIKAKIQYGKEE